MNTPNETETARLEGIEQARCHARSITPPKVNDHRRHIQHFLLKGERILTEREAREEFIGDCWDSFVPDSDPADWDAFEAGLAIGFEQAWQEGGAKVWQRAIEVAGLALAEGGPGAMDIAAIRATIEFLKHP